MTKVNVAVVYYSSTGTNHQMAKWAEEGAKAAGAAEVKFLRIPELAPEAAIASNPAWEEHYNATKHIPEATPDDLDWADVVIFSIPSRFGTVPGQVKQFIDTCGGLWAQGKLVNKVVSAMTSASNPHGGQEATVQSLYTNMHHWGAIVASPGYADPVQFSSGGNPYGVSVTVGQDGKMVEDVEEAAKSQAKRTVTIGTWIKAGMEG